MTTGAVGRERKARKRERQPSFRNFPGQGEMSRILPRERATASLPGNITLERACQISSHRRRRARTGERQLVPYQILIPAFFGGMVY